MRDAVIVKSIYFRGLELNEVALTIVQSIIKHELETFYKGVLMFLSI